ncbi:hypothetical protein GCM10022280_09380 [Sphingomonas swuensis]|uniref:Uncharacterized protein n=1 Tax=Sphingomonas swuensis TaxID=977800 RepID=A0ABP7SLV0_9SPHN
MPGRGLIQRLPYGAILDANGRLTILRVPPTTAKPSPNIEGKRLLAATPPGRSLDPSIAGGIKAFFRTRPQPQNDGLRITTMEYKYTQLRLVLIEGCFRADTGDGPLVVFPPDTRLFIQGGFLSVGVPGRPDMQARVGEELFWEAYAAQISEPKSLGLIHSICGQGAVLQVVPSSASTAAARQDAAAAIAFQRGSKGVSWEEALQAVQECDRQFEASFRRTNLNAPEIQVNNVCGHPLLNPPDQGNCPPGTKFRRGNCYDDEVLIASPRTPASPPVPPPAPRM